MTTTQSNNTATAPQACNSFWVNHAALLFVYVFLGLLTLNETPYGSVFQAGSDILFLLSLLIYSLPIFAYEFFVLKAYQRDTAGISFTKQWQPDWTRIMVKLWGLTCTLFTIIFFYWLFPEYSKDVYQLFFRLCANWLEYLIPVAAIYVNVIDGFLKKTEDEYWHIGLFFTGQWKQLSWASVGHHTRSWLIKAFFLPMMLSYLYGNYEMVINWNYSTEGNFFRWFDLALTCLYIADLIPACVGYMMNAKLFDNNIRSSESTVRGWLVCLICYTPFWHVLMYGNYLPYMDGYNWTDWLGQSEWKWVWAGFILLALTLYASASVCFGTRWSNLTYRGLISHGPYAITKHPAYVFKNVSWWLISVPFIVHGDIGEAIRQIAMILVVNFIYYQRAITEERHLSQWPEYREYATYMNERSVFRWVGKAIPLFRYDASRYGY